MSQSFQLVTCQGKPESQLAPYYCFKEWRESLRRYSVEPLILGQPPHAWPWGGLVSKVKFLKRAIDTKLIDADVVIFADCFDLVYAAHPREVVDAFVRMNVPIVIGAETSCFTAHNNIQLGPLHPPSPSRFKYVNTGFIIGYTEALDEALDEMEVEYLRDDYRLPGGGNVEDNDQNAWMRQLLFGKVRMGLDNTASLVLNHHGVAPQELEFLADRKICLRETGTIPLVHHWNGSKENPTKNLVLKHLGLL